MRATLKKLGIFAAATMLMEIIYLTVSNQTIAYSHTISFLTPIDGWIPFLPSTVFLYISAYFLWLIPILSRNISPWVFWKMIVITTITFLLTTVGYLLMPSTYPRPEISDVLAQENWPEFILKNVVYWIDPPNNTFPSLHVITAAILLLMMHKKMGKLGYRLYLLWGSLIILSVLTVKQHYFLDVVAGLVLVFLVKYGVRFIKLLIIRYKEKMPRKLSDIEEVDDLND